MEITVETATNTQSFPDGSLISSRLSSNAVGSLLQAHEFLCRFQQVLGVQDHLVFEELEKELICPWPDNLGYMEEDSCYSINTGDTYEHGESAAREIVEMNHIKCISHNLSTLHRALLPELVRQLLNKIPKGVNINGGVLGTLPINHLTWPEVVRKYIFAYVLAGGAVDSSNINVRNGTKLIHCLQGHGICCGSPTGVAGADLDAQLLGIAVDKVFGTVKRKNNTLYMSNNLGTDGGVPEWAKVLDPVKNLPTNVGSRIRSCVYEALKKNPPEWAKKQLEASIAKGVYKGNASGPTKKAISSILSKVSTGASRPVPDRVESKRYAFIRDSIMNKCRMVLRNVAACDTSRVFSNITRRNFNSDNDGVRASFGSAPTRPLDLRTIDLRLLHGTYSGSHEAFLEDVRELWINLRRTYKNRHTLLTVIDELSTIFETRYEHEVVVLVKRLCEFDTNDKFTGEVEKELEELLASPEIPEAPWETGICKVCGLNRDDKNVLLCDNKGCNAEYHTYCLTPPLSEIPEGDWYCPTCAPPNQLEDNERQDPRQILQFVKENREEASQVLDIAVALEETEYWDLDADKKTHLLQFLCDESLNSDRIRANLDPSKSRDLPKPSLRNELLGIDSVGRLYWGFPKTSAHRGIVVNEPANDSEFGGRWRLFQSAEDISNLADYLRENDCEKRKLRNSILVWEKLLLQEGEQNGTDSPNSGYSKKFFYSDGLTTIATALLEMKYNTEPDADQSRSKPRRKSKEKWRRCDCLEPIFPSRYHCVKCHETFFTNVEFERHTKSTCALSSSMEKSKVDVGKSRDTITINSENSPKSRRTDKKLVNEGDLTGAYNNPSFFLPASTSAMDTSAVRDIKFGTEQLVVDLGATGLEGSLAAMKPGVDGSKQIGSNTSLRKSDLLRKDVKNFSIPESSLKPIVGKARHILRQLKINLLDMEAALPDGAKRASRAGPIWRSAWCAYVKSANTIYEMIEAIMVFETMIKTEYINNTWWWYWSSFSAAAKTCTLSGLALRIYTLDAAIDYQLSTSSSDGKQSSPKPKEQSKKAKE